MTVNLISLRTDLIAAIQLGMSLALAVLIWKPIIAGIVLVVIALVMVIQSVVMDTAMAMKPKNHVQRIVQVVVEVKAVMTVNLILRLTDLKVVILHGMSLVLTVLIWKPIIAGIALVVTVQVMVTQFVVMVHVMVMKII
jgi:hypothetical protein